MNIEPILEAAAREKVLQMQARQGRILDERTFHALMCGVVKLWRLLGVEAAIRAEQLAKQRKEVPAP